MLEINLQCMLQFSAVLRSLLNVWHSWYKSDNTHSNIVKLIHLTDTGFCYEIDVEKC